VRQSDLVICEPSGREQLEQLLQAAQIGEKIWKEKGSPPAVRGFKNVSTPWILNVQCSPAVPIARMSVLLTMLCCAAAGPATTRTVTGLAKMSSP